ncbi:T9SS type A sorting domain-containing protein [Marinilabilia rubra]|nr:T9SS type A sorting domain-containing protein [Marinilabilia rubra]
MQSFTSFRTSNLFFIFILLAVITAPVATDAQLIVKVKTSEKGGIAFSDVNNHSTWGTATYDLQKAIDQVASNGGGTIWVAGGTYLPTEYLAAAPDAPNPPLQNPTDLNSPPDERQLSFIMSSGVSVVGGFMGTESSLEERTTDLFASENKVILSGDIGVEGQTEDNVYHVVIFPPESDNTAILKNVEVSGGYADGPDIYFAKTGAGVHIREGGLLKECMVVNNKSEGSGGGVYLYKGGRADSCIIKGNAATVQGGGVYSNLGGTVSKCAIFKNTAGNLTTDGKGGGIFIACDETQEGKLTHSYVFANSSTNKGGGVATYEGGQIINNYIGNNEASGKGGGIFLQLGGLALNNTVVSNKGERGAAVYCNDGGRIYNTVMWGNTTPYSSNRQLSFDDNTSTSQSPLIDFCAIQEGTASPEVDNLIILSSDNSGTENHPEFKNPVSFSGPPSNEQELEEILNSDYQFNLNSALLDAGKTNLSGLPVPDFDLLDVPRITKAVIDIGAIEAEYYNVSGIVNSGNGSITPDGTIKITKGADVEFILTPDMGYEIAGFTINEIDYSDKLTDNDDYSSFIKTGISKDLEAVAEYGVPNNLLFQKEQELKIFPVPVKGKLYIEGISVKALKIISASGQIVFENSNFRQNQINVSELSPGVYFLVVTDTNKKTISRKFLKQ